MGFMDRFRGHSGTSSTDTPTERSSTIRSAAEQELIRRLQRLLAEGDAPLRVYLRFSGTVQGVGFRWTNQGCARELHLTGWVKNLPDGTVEAEVQGPPSAIIKHLDAVHAFYSRGAYRITLDSEHEVPIEVSESEFSVRF